MQTALAEAFRRIGARELAKADFSHEDDEAAHWITTHGGQHVLIHDKPGQGGPHSHGETTHEQTTHRGHKDFIANLKGPRSNEIRAAHHALSQAHAKLAEVARSGVNDQHADYKAAVKDVEDKKTALNEKWAQRKKEMPAKSDIKPSAPAEAAKPAEHTGGLSAEKLQEAKDFYATLTSEHKNQVVEHWGKQSADVRAATWAKMPPEEKWVMSRILPESMRVELATAKPPSAAAPPRTDAGVTQQFRAAVAQHTGTQTSNVTQLRPTTTYTPPPPSEAETLAPGRWRTRASRLTQRLGSTLATLGEITESASNLATTRNFKNIGHEIDTLHSLASELKDHLMAAPKEVRALHAETAHILAQQRDKLLNYKDRIAALRHKTKAGAFRAGAQHPAATEEQRTTLSAAARLSSQRAGVATRRQTSRTARMTERDKARRHAARKEDKPYE